MGPLGEVRISSEYDVDNVLLLLKTVGVFLVVLVILVLLLLKSIWRRRLEGLSYDRAFPHRVVALRVDWAPLVVEDLVELILRLFILLTTQNAIHGATGIVWLALARWIPLVVGPSTVIVALPIVVVVTAWEAAAHLLLFVCPMLHHVA